MSSLCAGGQSLDSKYGGRVPEIDVPDRQWPSKRLSTSPIWMSTDLRDGNQSLPNPMNLEQKWRMYKLLVAMGFKQIEVSFPCASDTEYTFTRQLIETPGAVPDDVTLEVITPCRKETLKRAADSLKGAKNAILFTYLATSDNYRETILGISEEQWLEQARTCTEYARSITKDNPDASGTRWSFGFGFEDFANARPEAVARLGETIKNAWRPKKENPVILGLASSVEAATPNIFADQVERFARGLSEREKVCISIHTHNDRGGAVASAELACLAGADRLEGCLFGNGERAGNLDLVVSAMNFHTLGIETGLDFSNLMEVRAAYEEITGLKVHPRTPYSGDYYFSAFSGAHQDAIRKGLNRRAAAKIDSQNKRDNQDLSAPAWRVPYMPLDPADLGISFDRVIGINSQSGKSGISWILQQSLGLDVPDKMAALFSRIIKRRSEALKRGLAAEEVCMVFLEAFHVGTSFEDLVRMNSLFRRVEDSGRSNATALKSASNKISLLAEWLAIKFISHSVTAYQMVSTSGPSSRKIVFLECEIGESGSNAWGVGIGAQEDEAVSEAILSAVLVSLSVDHRISGEERSQFVDKATRLLSGFSTRCHNDGPNIAQVGSQAKAQVARS